MRVPLRVINAVSDLDDFHRRVFAGRGGFLGFRCGGVGNCEDLFHCRIIDGYRRKLHVGVILSAFADRYVVGEGDAIDCLVIA